MKCLSVFTLYALGVASAMTSLIIVAALSTLITWLSKTHCPWMLQADGTLDPSIGMSAFFCCAGILATGFVLGLRLAYAADDLAKENNKSNSK